MSNRSKLARERAGLSPGQAAKLLGIERRDVILVEELIEIKGNDAAELATLYGVSIEWITGAVPQHDFSAVDKIAGADKLTHHDREIIAEFAASMPREISPTATALREQLRRTNKETPMETEDGTNTGTDSAFSDQDQDDIVASLGEPEIAARSQKLHDAQEAWEEVAYLHNPKVPCPECTGAGSVGGGSLGDICVRCMGMRVIDRPGSEPLAVPPFAELRAAIGAYGDALADHALPSGHRAKKYLALPAAATVPTMESLQALETQALNAARQLGSGTPGEVPRKLLKKARKTKGLAGDGDLGEYEDAEFEDMEKGGDL